GPFATGCYLYTETGTDNVSNSAAISTTVKVDQVFPTATPTFPVANGKYNAAGWGAGCATVGLCGNAADAETGVANVKISVKRSSDNTYWNGAIFTGAAENLQTATGTAAWNLALPAASLTDGVTYTVHVTVTDAAGNTTSNATYTFLYDTTAPAFSSGASNILGTQLTWTLTETGSGLDTSSTTPGTAFTVLVHGSADPVTTVSTPDSTHVVLTLQNRVYGNDTVTVAYSSAALTAAQKVKDLAGNVLANLAA